MVVVVLVYLKFEALLKEIKTKEWKNLGSKACIYWPCTDCMDRVHPNLVTQQPPPPYYPSSGMENKALEHSLDLALDDPAKSPVYASQNGYGYHGNPPPQGPQGHNISGGECKSVQ